MIGGGRNRICARLVDFMPLGCIALLWPFCLWQSEGSIKTDATVFLVLNEPYHGSGGFGFLLTMITKELNALF